MNIYKSAASVTLALLMLSIPSLANALVDSITQPYFDRSLNECKEQLNSWQKLWSIEIGLAIFILVLGAISAAVQNFTFQSVKIITVTCGLAITITSGIVNMTRLNDHQTLSNSIEALEDIIRKMERTREQYLESENSKPAQFAAFQTLRESFIKLQEKPIKLTSSRTLEVNLFTTAYAMNSMSNLPFWVRAVPDDPKNLYFVGVADSSSFEDAVTSSKHNAIQSAAGFLAGTLKTTDEDQLSINNLVFSLTESAEEADSYSTLDKISGIFRYYTLIRINKSIADAKINYYAILHGANASPTTLNAISNSKRTTDDYSSKQFEQYEALLDKTSILLTPDEHRKFSEARALRKSKKDNDKSITLLMEILTKKPEFYMGWYNIALAYSASGKDDDAHRAYIKAIELEPTQPSRDGTIYNAYGDFLLAQKNYCQAISQFQISIEVDKNNPRAEKSLEQAILESDEAGSSCE